MLGVIRVACALKVFPIISPKPLGLPESAGLVCTITLESRWDTYNWQLAMAALSRLEIGHNELLDVRAHQLVPWVAPWVVPPVGPACVRHGCGGPPDVRA